MKQNFLFPISPDGVYQILSTHTIARSTRNYLHWVDETACNTTKVFYGEVDRYCFNIIPLVYGKNFFTPIISGEIKKNDEETTTINFSVRRSPIMRWVNIVFFLAFPIVVYGLYNAHFINGAAIVLPILITTIFLLLFIAFNFLDYKYKKKYIAKFMAFLKNQYA